MHHKITLIIILCVFHITIYSQNLSKTIQLEKTSYLLKELIYELSNKHTIKLAYNTDLLKSKQSIQFNKKDIRLDLILNKVCDTYNLQFEKKNNQIVLAPKSNNGKISLSGYIYDEKTGESLPAASIVLFEAEYGCSSNNYGYYSFSIKPGIYNITVTYVGYKPFKTTVELYKDTVLAITIEPVSSELQEVIVSQEAVNSKTNRIEAGMERLTLKDIESIPAFLGEVDVLKGMQFLPGVQGVNDGISLLSVRGGSFDQNLVLLDEAPVYNPTHVLGFFSVFNPDVVQQAEIYKGYIPAKYGGRLSSTIDIRMREGNRNKMKIHANVNNYASRLAIESPLFNKKTSFILSGRYSYSSLTPNIIDELNSSGILSMPAFNNYSSETRIRFWDFNAKINHKLNKKNHLYLSTYSGSDYFHFPQFETNSSMKWGNTTGTLRWNHIYNTRLFSNTSLIFSNYNYSYKFLDNGFNYDWQANIKAQNLKTDFDWFINNKSKIFFGASINKHFFTPGIITPLYSSSSLSSYKLPELNGLEPSVYVSYKHSLTKLDVETGLRFNGFISYTDSSASNSTNSNFDLAPRLALLFHINEGNKLKFAYSKTFQYLHYLKSAAVGLPTDIWLPASKFIKPQNADQISCGYFADVYKNLFEFSTEFYYKKMNHIIDFLDNADLFMNPHVENEIASGTGTSYGAEFMLSKKRGLIKGNISYTLSKTEKQIEGINENEPYPFSFDNRHCINANINVKITDKWSFMSNFTYKSGAATTMVESFYFYEAIPFAVFSKRNGYRLPDYHNLDVAFTRKSNVKKNRKWVSELTFGVNNIYNRKNVFTVFLNHGADGASYQKYSENGYYYPYSYSEYGHMKFLYLFGAMPFISYSIKF